MMKPMLDTLSVHTLMDPSQKEECFRSNRELWHQLEQQRESGTLPQGVSLMGDSYYGPIGEPHGTEECECCGTILEDAWDGRGCVAVDPDRYEDPPVFRSQTWCERGEEAAPPDGPDPKASTVRIPWGVAKDMEPMREFLASMAGATPPPAQGQAGTKEGGGE